MRLLPPANEDPFADCDVDNNEDSELSGLISQVQPDGTCSVKELIDVKTMF